jgi:hypothetical protein
MEVYKVVPTLLASFDIELEDPNETWWTCSRWFYRTQGVYATMKPRTDIEGVWQRGLFEVRGGY